MTRFQLPLLAVLFLLGSLTSCCKPTPIADLALVDSPTKWTAGTPWREHPESGGLKLEASFERSTAEMLFFQVKVSNVSDYRTEVAATDFCLEPVSERYEIRRIHRKPAVDPEYYLGKLEREYAQTEADLRNAEITGTITHVFGALGSVLDPDDSAAMHRNASNQRSNMQQQDRLRGTLLSLDTEQRAWRQAALRRSTLEPGESLEGRLAFWRDDRADGFKLIMQRQQLEVATEFAQHICPAR